MTPGDDEERKPPPPEAWDGAPVLVPRLTTAQPDLISDGGGLAFPPERPFEPLEPLDAEDPAVGALIVQIDQGRRQGQAKGFLRRRAAAPDLEAAEKLAGWRVLARADDEILFGRGRPPHLLTVAVRRSGRGRWEPMGVSNSRPLRASRDQIRASSWRLDPAFEPGVDEAELRVLVTEQTMASGALAADRLLEPEVFLGDEQVVVRIYVKPLQGYTGRARRHETPVIVRLPESLRGRRVLDGAVYEPPLG